MSVPLAGVAEIVKTDSGLVGVNPASRDAWCAKLAQWCKHNQIFNGQATNSSSNVTFLENGFFSWRLNVGFCWILLFIYSLRHLSAGPRCRLDFSLVHHSHFTFFWPAINSFPKDDPTFLYNQCCVVCRFRAGVVSLVNFHDETSKMDS